MSVRSWIFIAFSAGVTFACSRPADDCVEQPNITTPVRVSLQALESELLAISTKSELVNFFTRYPILREHLFLHPQYPDDSTFINTVFQRITNPYFDSLALETQRVFGDAYALKKELDLAFTNLKAYYPEVPIPAVQTILTGMETDLFVSDSLIVIGLDFYLGPGASYRPNTYDYILRQYVPQNIVPSIMLLYGIDARLNAHNNSDRTVLADMVAYGKAFHFAKHMLPCTPDSVFIGYTAKEISGARKNQDLIWYRLIEDKALYSTAHPVKQRYLGERPKTIEVGPECPGKIGQWVGWQIVDSYRKNHPELSLPALMAMSDADKLFKESKYKANKR